MSLSLHRSDCYCQLRESRYSNSGHSVDLAEAVVGDRSYNHKTVSCFVVATFAIVVDDSVHLKSSDYGWCLAMTILPRYVVAYENYLESHNRADANQLTD